MVNVTNSPYTTSADKVLFDLLNGELRRDEPMSRHTTLRVGGPARWFWAADDVERLALVLQTCLNDGIPYLLLGHGSNVLMSDAGYDGLIIQNRCKAVRVGDMTTCESGASLGALFHHTARAGYTGLEWAVGIPGTVGGALISNAGAYRGSIGPLIRSIRLVDEGIDKTVDASWMEFDYRDSKLRQEGLTSTVILSCTVAPTGRDEPASILAAAHEYQRQRRGKQPLAPSAGSFFKNVISKELAQSVAGLTDGMREKAVVPAGFLIEACGLKGTRIGGAMVSFEHANFLINVDRTATAMDFKQLSELAKRAVEQKFGVTLQEEVLAVGNW